MNIILIWAIILPVLAVLWYLFVRGFVINLVGLFQALPGIMADLACQLYLDITGLFKRRDKSETLSHHEEFENFWHD